MMPNFRRSEPELSKSQPTASANESNTSPAPSAPVFQPRAFLAVPRGTTDTPRSMSVIGADLKITGNLICKGEVQVDGIVDGDIQGSNVVVGEGATVTGGISGEEVIVRGHVVGSVRGKRVMLQTTSQVEGDIYHQSLSIEQGAMFEGKSRRTKEDPRTIEIRSEPIGFVVPPRLPN
jgi:cytoskeletal protein CcmA (bactofilin family)